MQVSRAALTLLFAAISAIPLGWGPFARAEDAAQDTAFTKRLFAGASQKSKAYACFTRVYDADHLARHPLQEVSAMKLLVASEWDKDSSGNIYYFRLGVKYRDRPGNFDSSGGCDHARVADGKGDPRMACSVDCDGGGIEVGLTPDDKSAMLRLERIRIWRNNHPDEDAAYALVAGADDRVFRLDRASVDDCAALAEDRKELAAMRSVANRK